MHSRICPIDRNAITTPSVPERAINTERQNHLTGRGQGKGCQIYHFFYSLRTPEPNRHYITRSQSAREIRRARACVRNKWFRLSAVKQRAIDT